MVQKITFLGGFTTQIIAVVVIEFPYLRFHATFDRGPKVRLVFSTHSLGESHLSQSPWRPKTAPAAPPRAVHAFANFRRQPPVHVVVPRGHGSKPINSRAVRHGPDTLFRPACRPEVQADQRAGSGLGCGRAPNRSLWHTRAVGMVPVSDAPRRWSDCTVPPLADADSCRLPPPPPSSGRQPGGRRYPSVRSTGNFELSEPLRTFGNSSTGSPPNQETDSRLVLTPEAAIAAFCNLALALFETHPPFP